MSSDRCPFEERVLHAVRENSWSEALRVHTRECESCGAAAGIGSWMRRFAELDPRQKPLPSPAVVWMKAQLLRSTSTVERASRPLQWAQAIAYLTVAAGWAALLSWKWNAIRSWIFHFTPGGMLESGASAAPLALIAGVMLLAAATVVVAMHTILAEE